MGEQLIPWILLFMLCTLAIVAATNIDDGDWF